MAASNYDCSCPGCNLGESADLASAGVFLSQIVEAPDGPNTYVLCLTARLIQSDVTEAYFDNLVWSLFGVIA